LDAFFLCDVGFQGEKLVRVHFCYGVEVVADFVGVVYAEDFGGAVG
jgi:hypothetical protein